MDVKSGDIVSAKISGIQPYGAFVTLQDGTNGLIHISEISSGYVKDVSLFVHVNDTVNVKIIDVDKEKNQVRCSLKALTARKSRRNKRIQQKALLPANKIGYSMLQQQLPIWIKQQQKTTSHNLT